MAEAARAVDVMGIAGIDPKIEPVALLDSAFAAPRRLFLSDDRGGKQEALLIPTAANGDSPRGIVQFGERRQQILIAEIDALGRPNRLCVPARHGKTKQKTWCDELV